MKIIKKQHESIARIVFEQHRDTDDRRCLSLYDFESPNEVKKAMEEIYSDLMIKKTGVPKCKLKVQILDKPSDNKSGKQKKLEWSYWLYGCDVNVIERLMEKF